MNSLFEFGLKFAADTLAGNVKGSGDSQRGIPVSPGKKDGSDFVFKGERKSRLQNENDHLRERNLELVALVGQLGSLTLTCAVNDDTIARLPRSLLELHLHDCKQLTLQGYKNLPPKLKVLCLNQCENLTAADTVVVVKELSRELLKLGLDGVQHLADSSIDDFPKGLIVLMLHPGGKKFTTFGRAHVDKFPKGLERLDICNSHLLSNDRIKVLQTHLTKLASLQLSGCSALTDKTIPNLPQGLKRLGISRLPHLTGSTFARLPATLENLGIVECKKVLHDNLSSIPTSVIKLEIEPTDNISQEQITTFATTNGRQVQVQGSTGHRMLA